MEMDFTQLQADAPVGDKPAAAKPAAGGKPAGAKPEKKPQQPKAQPKKIDGAHELGIEYTKEQNFSQWYSQIITKSGQNKQSKI